MKSPEQRKQEESAKKFIKETFPGGNTQIENEIRDVTELLNFRFSKDLIKEVYINTSAFYHISENKSREYVISKMLENSNIVLEIEDVIKIYSYVRRKYSKSQQSNFFYEHRNYTGGFKLLGIAKGGVIELEAGYKKLSAKGVLEVIIFNSYIIFLESNNLIQFDRKECWKNYGMWLSTEIGTVTTMPMHMQANFIKSKLSFYENELEKQSNDMSYLLTKVYSAFYKEPLINRQTDSDNLEEYFLFLPAFNQMNEWVRYQIETLLK